MQYASIEHRVCKIKRVLKGSFAASSRRPDPLELLAAASLMERRACGTGMYNGKDNGSIAYYNWFAYEFWRFVLVQQEIAKAAHSFIEYSPMQKGATFNLEG